VPLAPCLSGRRPDRKTSPTVPVQEAGGNGHRRRRTAVICRGVVPGGGSRRFKASQGVAIASGVPCPMEVLDRVSPARGAKRRIKYLDVIDIYAALNQNKRIAYRQRYAKEVAEMMHSRRFDRPVQVTAHARARMIQRGIDDALLRDLIETGERFRGRSHRNPDHHSPTSLPIARASAGKQQVDRCVRHGTDRDPIGLRLR
jgi:hypothetical protein